MRHIRLQLRVWVWSSSIYKSSGQIGQLADKKKKNRKGLELYLTIMLMASVVGRERCVSLSAPLHPLVKYANLVAVTSERKYLLKMSVSYCSLLVSFAVNFAPQAGSGCANETTHSNPGYSLFSYMICILIFEIHKIRLELMAARGHLKVSSQTRQHWGSHLQLANVSSALTTLVSHAIASIFYLHVLTIPFTFRSNTVTAPSHER